MRVVNMGCQVLVWSTLLATTGCAPTDGDSDDSSSSSSGGSSSSSGVQYFQDGTFSVSLAGFPGTTGTVTQNDPYQVLATTVSAGGPLTTQITGWFHSEPLTGTTIIIWGAVTGDGTYSISALQPTGAGTAGIIATSRPGSFNSTDGSVVVSNYNAGAFDMTFTATMVSAEADAGEQSFTLSGSSHVRAVRQGQ